MSDINRAYHARKTVRLGGRKLDGWTPKQVAELFKRLKPAKLVTSGRGATMAPPRFEDALPPNTEAVWSCGHVGGAVCAECYRLLAAKAHELSDEVDRLRDAVNELPRRHG